MGNRITELTPEQVGKIQQYVDWGVENGLSTDPIDEEAGRVYAEKLMTWLGRDYEGVIFVDSPLSACYAIFEIQMCEQVLSLVLKSVEGSADKRAATKVCDPVKDQTGSQAIDQVVGQVGHQVREQAGTQVWAQVRDQVSNQVGTQVWTQVWRQVRDQVWTQVGHQVRDQVWDQVGEQVWAQVRDQVWDQVRDQVNDQVSQQVMEHVLAREMIRSVVYNQIWDQIKNAVTAQNDTRVEAVWPYLDGQWYSYYVAWYNYYREVIGLDLPDLWVISDQIQFGGVYPLNRFVVICRRPLEINTNSEGKLHKDGGPAIRYGDGFSVYALNGVSVPEWLAVKRDSEIDPKEFASLKNVEVRREFVRKVGIERIERSLGSSVIDSQGDYQLLAVDLGGRTGVWPVLKMKNPSIDVYHMEFVPRDIETVSAALSWRNQSDLVPEQLT